jgi:acyl-CoA thioesterase
MASDAVEQLSPPPLAGEPGAFRFSAQRAWCTWNGLHGGALMGALIGSMEQTTGMPAASATAQFLKGVKEGGEVVIRAEVVASGSSVAQARAVATQDGAQIIVVSATLGAGGASATSARSFPRVPSAEDSPARTYLRAPLPGDVAETMEVRIAQAGPTGACLWVRCPTAKGRPLSAALLAAFADHPPFAVRLALGGDWYGISLEESLRIVAPLRELDGGIWTLVEVVFDALASPFAFATANVWSEDARLLAVSPQALRIRHGANPSAKKG